MSHRGGEKDVRRHKKHDVNKSSKPPPRDLANLPAVDPAVWRARVHGARERRDRHWKREIQTVRTALERELGTVSDRIVKAVETEDVTEVVLKTQMTVPESVADDYRVRATLESWRVEWQRRLDELGYTGLVLALETHVAEDDDDDDDDDDEDGGDDEGDEGVDAVITSDFSSRQDTVTFYFSIGFAALIAVAASPMTGGNDGVPSRVSDVSSTPTTTTQEEEVVGGGGHQGMEVAAAAVSIVEE